jgi:alkanesulfonate monooxygenase SsuD/methylene tetrahydromethanopterin reductase-like flavin-dependent oxidoreductase (luciferase family)
MKFSVTVGAAGAGRDPRGLAELARVVEGSGWDGLFLEDYLVYQGDASLPTYDPWICLAAMAVATDQIRIGTTVTPGDPFLDQKNPAVLAEMLDRGCGRGEGERWGRRVPPLPVVETLAVVRGGPPAI